MKSKWLLLGVAIALMVIHLFNADFSAYQQLSSADLVPVIAVALVIFLLKTGVLSILLLGIKKLWEWLRRK